MTKVNMLEAKTNLSKLVEAVESGRETEIILARNGKPVARIVPIEKEVAYDINTRIGIAEGALGDVSPEALAEMDREWEKTWQKVLAEPFLPDARPSKRRKSA